MGALLWFVAAAILAGLELLAGEFSFLMLALGALITAGVSLTPAPQWADVATFAVSSLGLWVFLRPYLHKRFGRPSAFDDSPRALVGKHAEVLEDITPDGGQVRLGGSIWSARALDPAEVIPAGQSVIVSDIDGPVAVVWKEP